MGRLNKTRLKLRAARIAKLAIAAAAAAAAVPAAAVPAAAVPAVAPVAPAAGAGAGAGAGHDAGHGQGHNDSGDNDDSSSSGGGKIPDAASNKPSTAPPPEMPAVASYPINLTAMFVRCRGNHPSQRKHRASQLTPEEREWLTKYNSLIQHLRAAQEMRTKGWGWHKGSEK